MNHPYNQAQAPQTWETTSLAPFLRHHYRVSSGRPNASIEAEIERARRILDAVNHIRQNPSAIHSLIQGITVPPLNANGLSAPPLYPNSDDQQGDDNRLLVAMVLLQHARSTAPIWLPPRPPAERINEPIRNRDGGVARYPDWTLEDAVLLQPPAPGPGWSAQLGAAPHAPPGLNGLAPLGFGGRGTAYGHFLGPYGRGGHGGQGGRERPEGPGARGGRGGGGRGNAGWG